MKHVQLFEQFINEKISKSDLKKIESYLNKQDEDTLFAFAEDAYGESDDDDLRDEWNDVKNDLSVNELIDYIIDHVKRFELDFEEFKDAINIYESQFINESKFIDDIKFQSHKKHNTSTDVIKGKLDKDTLMSYVIYVKKSYNKNKGDEFLEIHTGAYVSGKSTARTSETIYDIDKIPAKYKEAFKELKSEYEKKYK